MDLKGRKIFITGACGFIGSHLVERLIELGAEVKALVYYNSFNNWGWLETFTKKQLARIQVVSGDIRDAHYMRNEVAGMDVVFHLAALIAIPFSYSSPASYVQTNVEGTLNTLQAARVNGVKKFIHTSTSEVYGSARYVPIDEDHPRCGQSPYSASKIAADAICESFSYAFNFNTVIARPFNTYGPRQSARAIIPTIVTQILSGARELKLGSLHPTRDLNYVKDTVEGLIAIAEADIAPGSSVNIGTAKEISIGMLAEKIKGIMGSRIDIICEEERVRPGKSEVNRLIASNEKLCRLTKWRPMYSLGEGLKITIGWLEKNLAQYKTDIYNV